jgi:hypothetical protein
VSGHAHPFAVSITPAKQQLAAGVTHATKLVKVSNAGTEPLKVTSRELTYHQAAGGCGVGKADGWLSFRPASFTLKPGEARTVHVAVNAPAGAPTTDLLAVFTATGHATAAQGTGGSVGGSVASQLVVKGSDGGTAPQCGHHVAAAAPGGPGVTSFEMTMGTLLIAFLVVVAAIVVISRRQRIRPGHRHAA